MGSSFKENSNLVGLANYFTELERRPLVKPHFLNPFVLITRAAVKYQHVFAGVPPTLISV